MRVYSQEVILEYTVVDTAEIMATDLSRGFKGELSAAQTDFIIFNADLREVIYRRWFIYRLHWPIKS